MISGAKYVLGTDISEKMLSVAVKNNSHDRINYQCTAMEDLELEENSFDVVISSLALHYIKDFDYLIKNIS